MVMVISTIFHVYKLNIVKSHFQIDPFPKKNIATDGELH